MGAKHELNCTRPREGFFLARVAKVSSASIELLFLTEVSANKSDPGLKGKAYFSHLSPCLPRRRRVSAQIFERAE